MRGGDLLEALLGVFVPRVRVGVVLLRELPIRARHLSRSRFAQRREPRSSPSRTTPAEEPSHLSSSRDSLASPLLTAGGCLFVWLTIAGRIMRPLSRYPVRMVSATRGSESPSSWSTASCSFGSNTAPSASMRSRPAFSKTLTSCARMLSTPLRTFSISGASPARDGAVERVEHRQQLLDEPIGRAIDERGLLAQDALAVVLEVGLHAAACRGARCAPSGAARSPTRRRPRRPRPRCRRRRTRRRSR